VAPGAVGTARLPRIVTGRAKTAASPGTKEDLRLVMGRYATGAAIITATEAGTPCGLAVNSLTSVSLDPPLILFCPSKRSTTWPSIERAGAFAVNILGDDHEHLCRAFAGSGGDRFAGVSFAWSPTGNPILDDVIAHLDCAIDAVHDAGDHFIAVGRVLSLARRRDGRPLIFYDGRYHRLDDRQA
jgi:flavin reductase (DIM6/NTAB) family NADH-FMN oxidoreductase RutF